jgi:hypothetical protein
MSQEDAIIIKIRKLLRLSKSPNIHESERALAKAQELMATYNVNITDEVREPVTELFNFWGNTRTIPEPANIIHELATMFRCSILTNNRDKLYLAGYPEDIEIAKEVVSYAYKSFLILWKRYYQSLKPKPPNGYYYRKEKLSFVIGFVRGIADYMNSQATKNKLLVIIPPEVKEHVQQTTNRTLPPPKYKVYSDPLDAGYQAGKELQEGKRIEKKEATP